MLVSKKFGAAGNQIVIQELLEGMEISLHALCDGRTAKLFPTAQDHKRIGDGDTGLNTGGMGTYSPAPFLTDAQLSDLGKQILDPWLKGCAEEGILFRGILYPGVMLRKTARRCSSSTRDSVIQRRKFISRDWRTIWLNYSMRA